RFLQVLGLMGIPKPCRGVSRGSGKVVPIGPMIPGPRLTSADALLALKLRTRKKRPDPLDAAAPPLPGSALGCGAKLKRQEPGHKAQAPRTRHYPQRGRISEFRWSGGWWGDARRLFRRVDQ